MSMYRKLRKLKRDPAAFFRDSESGLVKLVGAASGYKLAIQAGRLDAPVKKASSNGTPPKRPSDQHKNVRSGQVLFANNSSDSLWSFYSSRTSIVEDEDKNKKLAIFPLGIPCIDERRLKTYESLGYKPSYLPIWKYFDEKNDIDDIEYFGNRNQFVVNEHALKMVTDAWNSGIGILILPYDSTALSRYIAIHCRSFGIRTVCHLVNLKDIDIFYGRELVYSVPVCDAVVIDPSQEAHLSRLAALGVKTAYRLPPIQGGMCSEQKNGRPDILRSSLGIGYSDRVFCIFLPPFTLGLSRDEIGQYVTVAIQEVISQMSPTDHLLIVSRRRSNGFLNKDSFGALSKKYRKSFLFYDKFSNLDQILSICDRVFIGDLHNFIDVGDVTVYSSFNRNENSIEHSDARLDLKEFDGQFAVDKISKALFGEEVEIVSQDDPLLRILEGGTGFDIVAVPDPISNSAITEGRQRFLPELINCRRRVLGVAGQTGATEAEVFVQWGAEPNEPKERVEVLRSTLARPRLYLEDGFIRSQGLWTDPNEPTLSVILDTRGIYYNALRPTFLENLLSSEWALSSEQKERSARLIDKIVANKISKYNYAPKVSLPLPSTGRKKILLVDQKRGDNSIGYGLASDETFLRMLDQASDGSYEVIIKQHPCAISGDPSEAHYTKESLGALNKKDYIHLVGFDINPYSLIEAVDEVWVVTSGMGFEALMAGKNVRCFGVPFYANWGLTQDEIRIDRRRRERSLEDIFYAFYVLLSRYVDPKTGERTQIERVIDFFASNSEV